MNDSEDVPPVLVRLVRDGALESVHRGHLVVADDGGRVLASLGEPHRPVYVRSAAKPLQAAAVLRLLQRPGLDLDDAALAIAAASHVGTDEQQIEAARLLALADLDESALKTPPAAPRDPASARAAGDTTSLAHNCSGKHAAFLLAQVSVGAPPDRYLALDSAVQRQAYHELVSAAGVAPVGQGVDGCGAPAWRMALSGLAVAFARLAAGHDPLLARVREAMTARPDLVGGPGCDDTAVMRADGRVVAKRGAEGVFAAGVRHGEAALGVAVKIADGGNRAAGPAVAAALEGLRVQVPDDVRRRPVLGGDVVHGAIEADQAVVAAARTTASSLAGVDQKDNNG